MRCLSLGEALRARGHIVELLGAIGPIPWLGTLLESSETATHRCAPGALDAALVRSLNPDRVVVDSYTIPGESVSRLGREVPCMAIVDGDDRGIDADLYLDQNLDAEHHDWPAEVATRLLAGSRFTLVRDAVLKYRRSAPPAATSDPVVVTFMGGTDPGGAVVEIARSLVGRAPTARLIFVCPETLVSEVADVIGDRAGVQVMTPTADLPAILGTADIAISAAGTSTWDLCSLGIPSIVISVVDNQRQSMLSATRRGFVLGFDASDGATPLSEAATALERLIDDVALQASLAATCLAEFDGLGKVRVAEAIEAMA